MPEQPELPVKDYRMVNVGKDLTELRRGRLRNFDDGTVTEADLDALVETVRAADDDEMVFEVDRSHHGLEEGTFSKAAVLGTSRAIMAFFMARIGAYWKRNGRPPLKAHILIAIRFDGEGVNDGQPWTEHTLHDHG